MQVFFHYYLFIPLLLFHYSLKGDYKFERKQERESPQQRDHANFHGGFMLAWGMVINMLGPRLLEAAKAVRPGNAAADIGTDHALLPIYLVKNGICPRVIACDIRPGPLCKAAKNISAHGLEDKIGCRRGDGLNTVSPGEAEDIIIAGMGGELISSIIERASFLRKENVRLILQPMSKPHFLRRFLAENGFEIIAESAVEDSGRYYTVMTARYSGRVQKISESAAYTGEIREGPEKTGYLKAQAEGLVKKVRGLRESGHPSASLYERIYEDIINEIRKNEIGKDFIR